MSMRPFLTLPHGLAMMLVAALSALLSIPTQAEELRHNPFLTPAYVRSAIAGPSAPKPEADAPPPRQLRAILLAGPNTVVQVDDQFLRMGEKLDGLSLVSATEHSATFAGKGRKMTLKLDQE